MTNSISTQIHKEDKEYVVFKEVIYDGEVKIIVEGAEFPLKTGPTAECLFAINLIKKNILEFINVITAPQFYPSLLLIFLLPKRKLVTRILNSFNRISNIVLRPYKNYKFYSRDFKMNLTAPARGIGKFTELFLICYKINEKTAHRTAETLAHLIEFDGAYRFRLLDMISVADYENMRKSPRKEIQRVLKISSEREGVKEVKPKLKLLSTLVWILEIPSIKKAFRKALKVDKFSMFSIDIEDWYWMSLRTEYNYFGKTTEERLDAVKKRGYKVPTHTVVERKDNPAWRASYG